MAEPHFSMCAFRPLSCMSYIYITNLFFNFSDIFTKMAVNDIYFLDILIIANRIFAGRICTDEFYISAGAAIHSNIPRHNIIFNFCKISYCIYAHFSNKVISNIDIDEVFSVQRIYLLLIVLKN